MYSCIFEINDTGFCIIYTILKQRIPPDGIINIWFFFLVQVNALCITTPLQN